MPNSRPGTDPDPEAVVARMAEADLESVLEIERRSYPTPWTRDNFLLELRENPFARNLVLRSGPAVAGFACLWVVDRELKINNIAIGPEHRGRGHGRRLLRACLDLGRSEGCLEATLEVRPSNKVARALYEAHGFRTFGRRKGYYQDTREDAILMIAPLVPAAPGLP